MSQPPVFFNQQQSAQPQTATTVSFGSATANGQPAAFTFGSTGFSSAQGNAASTPLAFGGFKLGAGTSFGSNTANNVSASPSPFSTPSAFSSTAQNNTPKLPSAPVFSFATNATTPQPFSLGNPASQTTATTTNAPAFSLGMTAPTTTSAASEPSKPIFGISAPSTSSFAFASGTTTTPSFGGEKSTFTSITTPAFGSTSFTPSQSATTNTTTFGSTMAKPANNAVKFTLPIFNTPSQTSNPITTTKPDDSINVTSITSSQPSNNMTTADKLPTFTLGATTTSPAPSFSFGNSTMTGSTTTTTKRDAPSDITSTTRLAPSTTLNLAKTTAEKATPSFSFGAGVLTFGAPSTTSQPTSINLSSISQVTASVLPAATIAFGLTTAPTLSFTALSTPSKPSITTSTLPGSATPGPMSLTDLSTPAKTINPISMTSQAAPPTFSFGAPLATTGSLAPITTTTTTTATTAPVTTNKETSLTSFLAPSATVTSTTTLGVTTPSNTTTVPATMVNTLRNKTLEEIINKWTHELTHYSREFHRQAVQVSQWDREIVSSSHKIAQLYNQVIGIAQQQREIDEDLEYVTSIQDELEKYLTSYEGQVAEMMESAGVPNNHTDKERETAYMLTEKLNEQLEDINQNLNAIVTEINTNTGFKTQDNDDTVTQIVKILNAHLRSLEWIDGNTTALSSKIENVDKLQSSALEEQERLHRGHAHSDTNVGHLDFRSSGSASFAATNAGTGNHYGQDSFGSSINRKRF